MRIHILKLIRTFIHIRLYTFMNIHPIRLPFAYTTSQLLVHTLVYAYVHRRPTHPFDRSHVFSLHPSRLTNTPSFISQTLVHTLISVFLLTHTPPQTLPRTPHTAPRTPGTAPDTAAHAHFARRPPAPPSPRLQTPRTHAAGTAAAPHARHRPRSAPPRPTPPPSPQTSSPR